MARHLSNCVPPNRSNTSPRLRTRSRNVNVCSRYYGPPPALSETHTLRAPALEFLVDMLGKLCRASSRLVVARDRLSCSLHCGSPLPRARNGPPETQVCAADLLAQPTWSVRSLQPDRSNAAEDVAVSSAQLDHLLRLSALPLRTAPDSRAKMVETLRSQLQFVRDIQRVDTRGVAPLRSIRDETTKGLEEQTIGLEALRSVLCREESIGHAGRPRMRKQAADVSGLEGWDALASATKRATRYFVVSSQRDK